MSREILDSAWPYFVLAGLLLLAAIATQFEVRWPTRDVAPDSALEELRDRDDLNVIFLLLDTLRADRLGAYGYERPTSPLIDALASRGVVFERVVSQSSWTKTSMASLWTGTHPIRNGVLRYNHVLPEEATLPAERFQDAGYETVGLWRNGWVEPNFGFSQGFDIYVRPMAGAERLRMQRQSPGGSPIAGTDEDMTVSAIDFIDQVGDAKFFLYLHYMDIHQYVYDNQSAIFGTSYSDAYDQSIRWTDRLLSELMEALRERDLLARSLIVIASDHGEAFLEHGSEGHARNLHQEVTHVPLIFIPPFLLEEGIRVPQTVSNVDIWPTVLDLVGLPPLPDADGESLVPLMRQARGRTPEETKAVRPVFAQLARGWGRPTQEARSIVSVTYDGRRLMQVLESPQDSQLFDRETDLGEQENLVPAQGVPASLQALVDAYAERAGDPPWGVSPHEVELDEMRLNHLRALGYVIEK